MIRVPLNWLEEVISVTPAIRPNCRSSGVATAEAMVSGLAPGKLAWTRIVGNSTCGSGATGRSRKASTPDNANAAVRSEVAIGLRMNGRDIFIPLLGRDRFSRRICDFLSYSAAPEVTSESIEE